MPHVQKREGKFQVTVSRTSKVQGAVPGLLLLYKGERQMEGWTDV